MSEFEDLEESETESSQERNPLRSRMRELESEIKSLRQQAAEAEQAKRELAFVKAGIDPSDTAAKYFVKGYDGELTMDAIKAAAVEARLLTPTQPQAGPSEQDAWNRTNQMAAGAGSVSQVPDLEARLNAAQSEEEVLQILREAQQ